MKRTKEMKKMREDRYTLKEIGKKYGVSKQRVYQILKEDNKDKEK